MSDVSDILFSPTNQLCQRMLHHQRQYLGASSITFWFRRCIEHSLSFSQSALPCSSHRTCNTTPQYFSDVDGWTFVPGKLYCYPTHLHLDVPRIINEFLNQHAVISKARSGFSLGQAETFPEKKGLLKKSCRCLVIVLLTGLPKVGTATVSIQQRGCKKLQHPSVLLDQLILQCSFCSCST